MTSEEFEYEQEKAQRDYDHYLLRREITKQEHEREIGQWLDIQD